MNEQSNNPPRDTIYASPHPELKQFVFDEQVAEVFSDMIHRSVPGYATLIHSIAAIAQHYIQEHSQFYDLGCSLGASTLGIRAGLRGKHCKAICVDNSAAMLDKARENIRAQASPVDVEFICANVEDVDIDNASLVVLNFTLQFIEPEKRQALLDKIYRGLKPGAALVLSEKILATDDSENALLIDLHHDFKRFNGYSDLEISQKRTALENVLIPETEATHLQRLRQAGFSRAQRWFQCYNFAAFIAIK